MTKLPSGHAATTEGLGKGPPRTHVQPSSPGPPGAPGSPFGPGGPCEDSEVACANDGPQKGELCNGNDDACDSQPGANDGDCDACPLKGGVTTEDEMFILIGGYFVP